MTTEYTFDQFREWLGKQPDDRPVRMDQPTADPDDCGCVMVQFARDHGFGGRLHAGFGTVGEDHESGALITFDRNIYTGAPRNGLIRCRTFGELKPIYAAIAAEQQPQ